MKEGFINGHYFPYCEWCEHDGNCALTHCEFLGVPRNEENKIDETPYPGHEKVDWHLSGFQGNTARAACAGRIFQTDSIYYPLACECGTVLSSLRFSSALGIAGCAKFKPNERGLERMKMAKGIAKRKHIALAKVNPEELLPEPDPSYRAAMEY